MPIGIIANFLAIVTGGLAGTILGSKLSDGIKEKLNTIFGVCAMSMGISSIILMKNMPAVILSVIVGMLVGHLLHLEQGIQKAGAFLGSSIAKVMGGKTNNDGNYKSTLITCVVLFCASGTGIYGSMVAGMTGDHSILLAKSILDFPTALIFACVLGAVTSFLAVPQLAVFLSLYFLAGSIYPFCTEAMISDFKACGGILLLATGFRMIRVKEFPVADMIPSMLIVMPLSSLWTTVILPLVS